VSPLRLRPEMRIPWQAIAAFAVALYLLRSALRSWDFRPDLTDVVVFGGLTVVLLLRPMVARWLSDAPDNEDDA
jgi:hypothetical protein